MENSVFSNSEPTKQEHVHRRVIIKIGSNVLLHGDGTAIDNTIGDIASSVHRLMEDGTEVVLVSSGAIALGRSRIGGAADSAEISILSAVGQSVLTAMYERAFRELGILSAQVLVTNDDVRDPARLVRFCHTLEHSMRRGFAAIVNENDVATHWAATEARVFHDNDMLAAIIAGALNADYLILLTDVDGVYTAHPSVPGARLLRNLADLRACIEPHTGGHGRGGMSAKVHAARFAVKHGCLRAVIANGRRPSVLTEIMNGSAVGTIIGRESAHD